MYEALIKSPTHKEGGRRGGQRGEGKEEEEKGKRTSLKHSALK